jgi:DNA-binding MarR family transcriptional regulator
MVRGVSELEADLADLTAVLAWREVVATHATVVCALDRELGEQHGLSASEFEVMERLAEHADIVGHGAGLRVQELSCLVHLSQSAVSRLISRLEKDGLVMRALCTEDRRGIYVDLTDAGRERCLAARPTYRRILTAQMKPAVHPLATAGQ